MPSKDSKVISVRVPERVNFDGLSMGKLITSLYEGIKRGDIKVEEGERVVTDCEGCPYIDDLDMSKFNEVCEFKGLERQKAMDRCVSMLWR